MIRNRAVRLVTALCLASLSHAAVAVPTTRQLQDPARLTVTYDFRVEVNITGEVPSMDAGIQKVVDDTLYQLVDLVNNQSNVPLQILNVSTTLEGTCVSTSDLCELVGTEAILQLRSGLDPSIVEFAILSELKRFVGIFNDNTQDVHVTYLGPFVITKQVIFQLQGVERTMTEQEVTVFEKSVLDYYVPYYLQAQPPIQILNATVVLQQLVQRDPARRRLQRTITYDNNVYVRVIGKCASCTSDDMLFDDAIDGGGSQTPNDDTFQGTVKDNGQQAGTDYFNDTAVTVSASEQTPDQPDGFTETSQPANKKSMPYWVFIILGIAVFIVTGGYCFAACRSRAARRQRVDLKRMSRV